MDGKSFINTEKKYLSNLKDLIKNNKIKEAIKVLNEVEKKGFSEAFINNLIYLFLVSKLKNQENVGSFFDGLIINRMPLINLCIGFVKLTKQPFCCLIKLNQAAPWLKN